MQQQDRLRFWTSRWTTCRSMSLYERDRQLEFTIQQVPVVGELARMNALQEARFATGDAALFQLLVDLVIEELVEHLLDTHPDAEEKHLEATMETLLPRVETHLKSVADELLLENVEWYGGARWLLLKDGPQEEEGGTRGARHESHIYMLWTTVLAFLMVVSLGRRRPDDEYHRVIDACRTHVGGDEFRFFSLVILSLNRFFGMLNPNIYRMLELSIA